MNAASESQRRIIFPGVVLLFVWSRSFLAEVRLRDFLALGTALVLIGVGSFVAKKWRRGLACGLAGLILVLFTEYNFGGEWFGDSTVRLLDISWNFLYRQIIIYIAAFFVLRFCVRLLKGRKPPSWLDFLGSELGRPSRLALLILSALYIYSSLPSNLIVGRFWAEEGTIYFKAAWEMPAPQFWLFVSPAQGYYGLITNIGALAASHLVPLERAPQLTTFLACAVQLVPVWVLIYCKSDALPQLWMRVAGVGCLLLIGPNSEVWANTTNSQFWMMAAAGLILVTSAGSTSGHVSRLTILVFSALSGVICCIFWPFFVAVAFLERTKQRWQECWVYGAAGVLQVFVVLGQKPRPTNTAFGLFPSFQFMKGFIAPLFGTTTVRGAERFLRGHELIGTTSGVIFGSLPFLVAGAALLVYGRRPAIILFCCSILAALVSFAKPAGHPNYATLLDLLKSEGAGRYYLVPNVLLGLACCMIPRASPRFQFPVRWMAGYRNTALACVACALATGYSASLSFGDGPDWQDELAKWRKNPAHTLRIWPRGWYLQIRPDHRPVPQPPNFSLKD